MDALRQSERAARNTDDGYWIAADVPLAADHAKEIELVEPIEGVVLASDGAAAAVQKYELVPGWREFANPVMRDGQALPDLVREAELRDPDGRRWPRSKRHDDMAAQALRVDLGPF
jgi:hypothetical protein